MSEYRNLLMSDDLAKTSSGVRLDFTETRASGCRTTGRAVPLVHLVTVH